MRPDSLSAAEARRAVLAAQGLASRSERKGVSGFAPVQRIERLNLLQIDSVNVLARAHYLPVYSRLGPYDRTRLDARAFGRTGRSSNIGLTRRACSLSFWPLLPGMRRAADRRDIYKGLARFAEERRDYIDAILRDVRSRGPVTARELSATGARTGPWWGWHDGKIALEYLFWSGAVTAAGRRGFERIYDIPERAIPAETLAAPEPRRSDAIRALLSLARALGVASEADLRDYFRLPVAESATALRELVAAGELLPAKVEGWRVAAYLHRDATIPARAGGTALLSPFDPLVWERGRTERLFNFRYRIEIYTPAHLRQFGYYVLPFLMDGRLVGRACLKADRQAGVLRVNPAITRTAPTAPPQRSASPPSSPAWQPGWSSRTSSSTPPAPWPSRCARQLPGLLSSVLRRVGIRQIGSELCGLACLLAYCLLPLKSAVAGASTPLPECSGGW